MTTDCKLLTREQCANFVERYARKWWAIHRASNKHAETTRKAYDDFCALQAAIRSMGEPTVKESLQVPQSTHSADCYKWHHECAIARIEELKLLCEEMLSELYVYRASKHLKDVTAAITKAKSK